MTKEEFIVKCNEIAGTHNDCKDFEIEIKGLSVHVINEDGQFIIHVWKNGEEDDRDYFAIAYNNVEIAYHIILQNAK